MKKQVIRSFGILLILALALGAVLGIGRRALADTDPVASVTSGVNTTPYDNFDEAVGAWNQAGDGASLTLLADVKTERTIDVSGTKTLDLNGYGITYKGNVNVIQIGSTSNLTITDSRPDEGMHRFRTLVTGEPGELSDGGDGSFTGGYITGGQGAFIYDDTNEWRLGGCVYIDEGTLNLKAGTMVCNRTIREANVDGGTVAIHGGTFNMSGGAILAGFSRNGAGGVMVGDSYNSTGTFSMTGGSIMGNSGTQGSAVRVTGSSIAAISGGTISGNYCWHDNCTVSVEGAATLELRGGTIQDYMGQGIAVDGGATILLSGNPVVSYNSVYLKSKEDGSGVSAKLTIDGALTNGAFISVRMEKPGVFTNSSPTTYNDASKFSSYDGGYAVEKYPEGHEYAGQLYLSPVTVTYDADGYGTASGAQRVASGSPARLASRPSRSSSKRNRDDHNGWGRVAGDDRYQTMADVATSSFDSSTWAVLASGADFPDALTSASLAGVLGCPMVTTASDGLTAETADVLSRLSVTHAIVVGGERSVSEGVLSALASMGIEATRVAGEGRVATSLAVLRQGRLMGGSSDTVIVATGTTFADALSIGPLSYLGQCPIVLTEGRVLSEDSLRSISEDGFTKAVVLGGASSVSPEAEAQLAALGVEATRIAGADRYETSAAIATFASGHGLGFAHPVVASGAGFSDALVGAPLAARKGGVLLLVSEDSTAAEDLLRSHRSEFVSGTVLGGPGSVSDALVERLEAAVA